MGNKFPERNPNIVVGDVTLVPGVSFVRTAEPSASNTNQTGDTSYLNDAAEIRKSGFASLLVVIPTLSTLHDHYYCHSDKANGEALEAAINWALEAGYRHFDTAAAYMNEEIVGKVLKEWISSGRVNRSDLFIVTKLPPNGNSAKGVEKYVSESLEKLGVEYIDLYLIHVPFGFKEGNEIHPTDDDGNVILDPNTSHMATWTAMEKYVKSGKLKAIGLSNFTEEQIERILVNGQIKPANLQIEMHLFHQQKGLIQYCQSKEIIVTAYSPLGTKGTSSLLQASGISKDIPDLLGHPDVQKIAQSLGKSPAQILLRFLLEKGVAVIPKSTSEGRIKSNIKVYDFELGESFMETLESLDQGEAGRIVDMKFFKGVENHPEYPFQKI